MESSTSSRSRSLLVPNGKRPMQGIGMDNPFSFKVLQVFTGFGIGCGVGIGIGQPINLGMVPMVGQVMSAARGATDAFRGVTRHVNSGLRRVGAKNIQAGVGCGVGFGHGFGVGFAVKPSVLQKLQASLVELAMKMMAKLGSSSDTSTGQVSLPTSSPSDVSILSGSSSTQNPLGGISQLAGKLPDNAFHHGLGKLNPYATHETSTSANDLVNVPFASQTEKVLTSFLQNPILKQGAGDLNESAERLRLENNVLQMVLKHQQVIDDLMEENERLRQILIEDLKVSPGKLKASYSPKHNSPCSDCIECRRKQGRRR